MNFLKGYRTYILASLTIVITVLYAFNLIDVHSYTILISLFGGGSIASLRAALPPAPVTPDPTNGTTTV